jgi:hypothetical protein
MAPMPRSQKLDELVGSVEDLLARLPERLTPEIAELRDKVDAGIFAAWTAIARADTNAGYHRMPRADAGFWSTVGWALLAGTTGMLAYQITRPGFRLP